MTPSRHHRRLLASVLAGTLTAAALASCGGAHKKPSDAQQIKQALRSYIRAQAAGDGQTACALLTAGAQQQLITLVVKASKGLVTTRPSCVDAVGLVRAAAGQQLLGALDSARIEHVDVTGASASAEVVDGGQFPPQRVSLLRSHAAWRVAGVPGLGG